MSGGKHSEHQPQGMALSSLIQEKLRKEGIPVPTFAARIGVSTSYSHSLLRNEREWASLALDTKRKIAKFLDTSFINVLMLAGELEPEDFVRESGIEENLEAVYRAIISDKKYSVFLKRKAEWDGLPDGIKIFIALLYEKCAGIELLEKARMVKIKFAGETK